MTEHSYNFVKYTAIEQSLLPAYDPIDQLTQLMAIKPDGTTWTATLPEPVKPGSRIAKKTLSSQALALHAERVRDYTVLDGDVFARFRYRCLPMGQEGDTMEVHFVSDAESDPTDITDRGARTAYRAVIQPLDGWSLANLAAVRFVVAAAVRRLHIIVHADAPDGAADVLSAIEWEDTSIMVGDSGEVLAGVGQER